MKKLILLLSIITIVSCKKEDDNPIITGNPSQDNSLFQDPELIGTWLSDSAIIDYIDTLEIDYTMDLSGYNDYLIFSNKDELYLGDSSLVTYVEISYLWYTNTDILFQAIHIIGIDTKKSDYFPAYTYQVNDTILILKEVEGLFKGQIRTNYYHKQQ